MNFESMKEIIVRAAKEAGLTEYELYYYADEDMSVGALKKEIDSFSSGNSQGIDFRCKVGGKMGYASTELFTEEELAELADQLRTSGKVRAYGRIMDAVSNFDMVNAQLDAVVKDLTLDLE